MVLGSRADVVLSGASSSIKTDSCDWKMKYVKANEFEPFQSRKRWNVLDMKQITLVIKSGRDHRKLLTKIWNIETRKFVFHVEDNGKAFIILFATSTNFSHKTHPPHAWLQGLPTLLAICSAWKWRPEPFFIVIYVKSNSKTNLISS